MTPETAKAARNELDEMRDAKRELGQAHAYLSTREAVERSRIDLCEETLTGYPNWICPRTPKNPAKEGSPLLWDPRDIQALPLVLRQWAEACESGDEESFKERRVELLREREERALRAIIGGSG